MSISFLSVRAHDTPSLDAFFNGNPKLTQFTQGHKHLITLQDYFFDVELLTDGKPPNDRGCRMCGKIGHLVKDCPNRPGNKRRQQ